MTPKEEAQELYDKMYDKVEDFDLEHDYILHSQRKIYAKKCALIAVDEILKSIVWHHDFSNQKREYWQAVKTEIENL